MIIVDSLYTYFVFSTCLCWSETSCVPSNHISIRSPWIRFERTTPTAPYSWRLPPTMDMRIHSKRMSIPFASVIVIRPPCRFLTSSHMGTTPWMKQYRFSCTFKRDGQPYNSLARRQHEANCHTVSQLNNVMMEAI